MLRHSDTNGGTGRFVVVAFALLLWGCLLVPTDAWGRAGGGGSYSSGGGGGGGGGGYSGGGGSGGGGADLILLLIELCIRYPKVGIPVTIMCVVGYAIYYSKYGNKSPASSIASALSGRVHNGRVNAEEHARWVKEIQESDAAFDQAVFRKDFEHAFVEIQQAWQNQDMASVQHFVTDGIFEKFAVQFRAQQLQNYREKLEKIRVRKMQIAEWRSAGMFEVLTVEVAASMADYRVGPETGEWISGSRKVESFVEYWSFIRRRNLQSADRRGSLLNGDCPNCGSTIELNQFSRCTACDAVLRSGTYDWVLSEITQASEWRSHKSQPLVLAEQYRKNHDPEFSLQHLEDRAAVIFYRKVAAELAGSIDPLRKMATEDFCDTLRPELTGVNRDLDIDCAVGSVECLGLLAETERHYAVVEVRWNSRSAKMGEDRKLSKRGGLRMDFSWLVLMRGAAVSRNIETGLESTHCAACGAPESDLDSDACEYCGEVMNTGLHDWVLVEFHRSRTTSEAGEWKRRLQEQTQSLRWPLLTGKPDTTLPAPVFVQDGSASEMCPAEGLAWVIRVLAEDAELDDLERGAIRQLASKNRISEELVQQWIDESLQSEPPAVQKPEKASAQHWLSEVVGIALADNQIDDAERQMLKQLAVSLGMSWYDVNLVIRKKQFRQAGSTDAISI